MARYKTFMGKEYCIEVGFRNETHPALVHVPTRILQLETRARDLEWEDKCALSLRREIKRLEEWLEESGQEYMPTH